MKVEVLIPVIICIMIGVLFFVGYLVHVKRIAKKLGYSMMAIFCVFSLCICGAIYKKNVALRESAILEAQRIEESQKNLRPALPYLTASDVAINARTTSKEQMMSILANKQLIVNHLYLTGVLEKDSVFVFANSPNPVVSKNVNIFFFGKGITDEVNAKLKSIPKGKDVLAIVEFVDLQDAGADLGFPVKALIVLIYDVKF